MSIPTARTRGYAARLMLTLICILTFIPNIFSISTASPALSSPTLSSPSAASQLFKRQVVPDTPNRPPSYSCDVVGECLACSALQIQTEESCKETHNRQRIDCKYDDPKNEEDEELKIRLPTYQSCLHVKAVEARRFAHFFSTNVFLAFFSGVLLMWRKRKLAAAQYRRMARRIGIA